MRTWVYTKLLASATFVNLVGGVAGANGKIYAPSAVPTPVPTGRFATYRMGERRRLNVPAWRQTLWVYVHDEPGDYLKIDEALEAARVALEQGSLSDHIVAAEFIEGSRDLPRDPDWDTISKYYRFQITQLET